MAVRRSFVAVNGLKDDRKNGVVADDGFEACLFVRARGEAEKVDGVAIGGREVVDVEGSGDNGKSDSVIALGRIGMVSGRYGGAATADLYSWASARVAMVRIRF